MKTPRDIANTRLHRQGLVKPAHATAADVVRALCAVQAQDFDGAKWAIAQRMRGSPTDEEVEREFAEGRLIRTHVLRPTWHFVAPEDLRWMLALTGPRVSASMGFFNRYNDLTPELFARCQGVIVKALDGGKHLTRSELAQALARSPVGQLTGTRLAGAMMQAEVDAVVCSGPRRGKQFTYALVDEWVPKTPPRDRDDALAELTRRYFRVRGPATMKDFAWWSGLTVADAKRGIEVCGRELERVTVGDQSYWHSGSGAAGRTSSPRAHLLPNYDEYFIGFKDRGAIAQRLGHATLVTGGNALIAHVVLINGQLVGGWKRAFVKHHAVVTLRMLARLTAVEKQLVNKAAQRFGKFLGLPVKLVSARPSRGAATRQMKYD
ncbi:MAG: winged helix DNA-binding domain-containing protein [Gemmatimonadaceae bacterium]